MRASGDVVADCNTIVIDFAAESDAVVDLNGGVFRAETAADLASLLRAHRTASAGRLLSIPFKVGVEGQRLLLKQDGSLDQDFSDLTLTGADATAAIEKASQIARSRSAAWPEEGAVGAGEFDLDALSAGDRWEGPLVVSMPRTGSTLMGMLFLFCRNEASPSGYRFDRYLHEPAAPVFWRGDSIESVARFVGPGLSPADIVQESAYQFADPDLARWFLGQARQPVVFTIRHPQLAWPSRWRSILSQLIDNEPDGPIAVEARQALADNDFSSLGGFLTEAVRPADNGFFAVMSLIEMCRHEGIEFVIVDNTRFRTRPAETMCELCGRLDLEFDEAITTWTTLQPVLPRVVMSGLALGDEFPWYYERTLSSARGIEPETRPLLDGARFPAELRGMSSDVLTIDEAVTWHRLLLARPETLP